MQDLNKFKNEMNLSGQNVYVGHRYVPKIMGDWDNTKIYEPLSIVTYQGNSFTSRQYVPSGVEITNKEYWASTGNYNAQVEQYRQDVRNLENGFNNINDEVITARNGETTLSAKLKKDKQEVNEQLAQIVTNVKMFGAVGDGVADDTQAIKDTISFMIDNGGGTIFFPTGKYRVTSEIILTGLENTTLLGSKGSEIIIDENNDDTLFWGEYNKQLTFDGLTIKGNRKYNWTTWKWPHKMNAAIITSKAQNIRIQNCNFIELHYGVMPLSSSNSKNGWVINNFFENCNSDIDTYASEGGLFIEDNVSRGCTENSIQIEPVGSVNNNIADFRDEPDFNKNSVNNFVINNTITDCEGIGINLFSGSQNVLIDGNNLTNIGVTGIRASHTSMKNIIITNNNITNVTGVLVEETGYPWGTALVGIGIAVANGKSVIVNSNNISYARLGIYDFAGERVTITNNIVSFCKTSGISVYNSIGTTVNGNTMTDNAKGVNGVYYYKNSGVIVSGTSKEIYLANNVTRDSREDENRQRACIFVDSNCTDVINVGNVGLGVIEGTINFSAVTEGRLSENFKSEFSSFKANNDVDSRLGYLVNGKQVIGSQQGGISDAVEGQELAKINNILAVLRSHGLISE